MKINNEKKASIMLVVVILSTSIMILFLTVSSLAKQYRDQIWKLAYWIVAQYSAESAMEEAIVKYFEKSEKLYSWSNIIMNRRSDVIYWKIKDKRLWKVINKNLESNEVIDSDILVDFSKKNVWENIIWINHVWDVSVSASRLVNKVKTRINPYWSFEFRLTAEEREINWSWSQDKIKQLRLKWSLPNWEQENAWLDVVQARWPIAQPWNTQTHRIWFSNWSDNLWNSGSYIFGDLWTVDLPKEAIFNLPSDENYKSWDYTITKYEYIFIFKARVFPIILTIEWLDESWESVKLPSRYAYFKTEAKIWWITNKWENYLWSDDIYKTYTKRIESKKEIYTNYDSNFDYARNFMIF